MDFSFLTNTLLFRGADASEAEAMLKCLGASEKRYNKGEVILRAGECIESMGLVLAGSVNIAIEDLWGNATLLGQMEAGQIFAETYACISGEPLMVSVLANEKCAVLFLNASRLLTTCQNSCAHHAKLIRNLLQITARKNLELSRRSLHTSAKSIRGRVLSYLSEQAKRSGCYQFAIPYSRQQLADYLGVDRSALSNELSKLQKEGVLAYEKNRFSMKPQA